MMQEKRLIRIGTRGSNLALAQTNLVIEALKQNDPNLDCEIVVIQTIGDKILEKPLQEFGGKAVFVTEFEEKLLENKIDLAVHSAKDMPMELSKGLKLVGVLKREDPRDVLITMQSVRIEEMESALIGTSSLRRQIQIEQLCHNVTCSPLRGNVNTRLRKLSEGNYAGIILAAAGIKRLNLEHKSEYNYRYFDFDEMIPACGQGIIAIEGRSDCEFSQLVGKISDSKAEMELIMERYALELFGAGCHEPIGIFSEVNQNEVTIRMIKEVDGKMRERTEKINIEKRMILVEHMVSDILEEN